MSPRLAGSPITWGWVGGGRWGVDLPTERVLAELARVGFTATEVGVPGFLPDDPGAARELLERHGLTATSGPVSFVVHEGDLDEALARVGAACERLAAIGAEVLITVPKRGSVAPGEPLSPDGWDRLIAGLAAVEAVAADHGLAAALHPHVGSLVETGDDMRALLDRSDVGWCLDTAHVASGGLDPAEFAAAAAGRVNLVHLKDLDVDLGRRMVDHSIGFDEAIAAGVFVPLGQGDLDVAATVAALPTDVWWVLEQDRAVPVEPAPGEGPMLDAAASLATLTKLRALFAP